MELGPWTFDRSLLILKELTANEDPKTTELYHAEFWVQIYQLPAGLFSTTVGKALGDFIGDFVAYDDKNVWSFRDPYMRIRVRLDVRKPLKRGKKVRQAGGEGGECIFRYEHLPNFCYICGKMGHIDRYCEILFHVPENQIVRLWDQKLRAPPRKPRAWKGDKWILRWEDGAGLVSNENGGGESGGGEGGFGGDGRAGMRVGDGIIPKAVACLMGNFGASLDHAQVTVVNSRQVVEEEEVELAIHDDKMRRRESGASEPMEGVTGNEGNPRKSPKKSAHVSKNVVQAGRGGSTCQSS
ncbi:hypothetical protein LINPERHAP1_LOCUS8065 [Linum perenne]